MKSTCRNCNKKYNFYSSRAWYTGYCTQRCLKAKAMQFGWKPSDGDMELYHVLKRHDQIGNQHAAIIRKG